jgi:hypothetical protein
MVLEREAWLAAHSAWPPEPVDAGLKAACSMVKSSLLSM